MHELCYKVGEIIYLEYVFETESVNVYYSDGCVISYFIETHTEETVYQYSNTISAVASSPDQDLLAVILGDDKLVLSSRGTVVIEKNLHDKHSECIEKVDVGWGSKETQFHGSEGKEARKVAQKPIVPASDHDDRRHKIIWRGDGCFFATSSIHQINGNRYLRIWTNEGLLQYESEYVEGLEDTLTWRPDGSLITSSQSIGDKHKIIFFEKNGLTHGEFDLPNPANQFKIKHLEWSPDSKILAIQGNHIDEKTTNLVYFYHRNNYHWYQKYVVQLNIPILSFDWSQSCNTEVFFTTPYEVHQITFKWDVDRICDIVGAIDRNTINFTPFKFVNIPPPMSAYTVSLDFPVNEISLIDGTSFLVKSLNSLHLIRPDQSNQSPNLTVHRSVRNAFPQLPKLYCSTLLNWEEFDIQSIQAISPQKAIAVKVERNAESAPEYGLVLIDLINGSTEILCKFSTQIIAIDYCKERSTVAIELSSGELNIFDLLTKKLNDWSNNKAKFPSLCLWIKAVSITNEIFVLGMTTKGSLFLNERLLLNYRCTSFALFDHRTLVITTNNNFLLSWRLDDFFLHKLVSRGQDPRDEPRSIERGGKIVSLVVEDAKIILQMPRGNIETINPRTLLIQRLKELLEEKSYGRAFQMMRKNRINLNLLVDHNLQSFIDNINFIVQEIGKDDVLNICLLLSELKNEDVTKTMYSFAYGASTENVDQKSKCQSLAKLDEVCRAIRGTMKKISPTKYLIPIAVTHLKETKPTTAKALELIFNEENEVRRDEAIKYLLYLTDVESLYKEALSTYNFDIVLMVVQKSQKDPKEYLQYINSLKSIDDVNYRKFKIDVDLKKFDKAIEHMRDLDPITHQTECINFVLTNKLYWTALENFPPSHPWCEQIWCKFGDYLLSKRYYEEAGIAFERGKDFVNSIKCYQLAGNWNCSLSIASRLDKDLQTSQLEHIATNLVSAKRCSEAATIYENYLNNHKEAVNVLLNGGLWDEAFRVMSKYDENSELVDNFKKEVRQQIVSLNSSLIETNCKLQKHYDRLEKVELQKIVERENNPGNYFDDDGDSLSDVSSVTGSNSIKSSLATRRTKPRRKRNYLKYSTKEGHRFEHLALRLRIKEMIESLNTLINEAISAIRWLYYFEMAQQAVEAQDCVLDLSKQISGIIKSLWPENQDFDGKDNLHASHPLMSDFLKEPSVLVPPTFRTVDFEFKLLRPSFR